MSDHWERVTRLFDAARALGPAERSAFLGATCSGDEATRSEVESLLDSDEPDSFLSRAPSPLPLNALREWVTVPEAGQLLRDRYRLEARIATGGQALVYRATDEVLSRPVVVKVLRAEGRHDEWLQSRLTREKEALARIDHPGVVGILDTGELADGSPFLVIQFIEGQSLRERLREGPMHRSRAVAILRQIGAALNTTHALGIAHRDLKPENVMLQQLGDGTESVKLIDFGIAKIERSQLDSATTTVMIAGTVRYMAPEQLEGKNSIVSDVYSLALIACEMLCGHPDLRALPSAVNRRTRRLLEAALAFRPEDRPPQVRAWSEELAGTLASESRRRFVLAAGGSAAVLAVGIIGGDAWHKFRQETPRLIEYAGAFDPLTEGFQIHNDVVGTIANNPERTGYDGWRITSPRQGAYYHHLSDRQKRLAFERGWKLTAVMRADEGLTYAAVDFARVGRRFDIGVYVQPKTDLVRLGTQIVPDQEGLDFPVARTVAVYRRYELVYDPALASASLWVDGRRALAGYRGYSQFQENLGLFFGTSLYASSRGMGTFQSVRFEINP
jgi:tRNA A-37 threonylcarbamoyl transferase component Bud32